MTPEEVQQFASLLGGGGSFVLMLVFVVRVFKSLLAETRTAAALANAEAERLRRENAELRAENEMLKSRLKESP